MDRKESVAERLSGCGDHFSKPARPSATSATNAEKRQVEESAHVTTGIQFSQCSDTHCTARAPNANSSPKLDNEVVLGLRLDVVSHQTCPHLRAGSGAARPRAHSDVLFYLFLESILAWSSSSSSSDFSAYEVAR